MPEHRKFELTVNKQEKEWPTETITGADIKTLAGSPADWVVNQIVSGPGDDPEIGNTDTVHLDPNSEPKGKKRFNTRKPTTSPGL